MEDNEIKIQITYNGENKFINLPDSLEDLTIDFKDIFKINKKEKYYFVFSYDAKKFIHAGNFKDEINVLKKREKPIIYAEESCEKFNELLNNPILLDTVYPQNSEVNLNEIKESDVLVLGNTTQTININEENNINEEHNINEENNINENNRNDLKENLEILEKELKKTEDAINNEINNINIFKEKIDFLNDINKEKIPFEYDKLKKQLENLKKENEQKSNEIKELNIINEENIRLKKIINEKDNIIQNLNKTYKNAINELKNNFIQKIKELEENTTSI